MSFQAGEIQFGTTNVVFEIRRSKARRTIAVTVQPDSTIQVVAPRGVRRDQICRAVESKADWVIRQQEFFRRHHCAFAKDFVSGESFFYLGRQHKLKVSSRSFQQRTANARLVGGHFLVTVVSGVEKDRRPALVRDALGTWYRARAKHILPGLVQRLAQGLGLRVSEVVIRDMKRRWGSAKKSGHISFNWRVVMAPKRLIEYVVAHELCHLKVHDHSKTYWRLLERVMPDYERRRIELAVHGPKYDLPAITCSGSPHDSTAQPCFGAG